MRPLSVDTWGDEERRAIQDVVDSGQYTMGPRVAEFEAAYAKYCGTKYAVACNSGSSANLLMVAAYTLRKRDNKKPRVAIVPAVGWATSYSPLLQYGWRLLFCDIDRETLNFDLKQLRWLCENYGPHLIFAINLLGNCNEYDKFPKCDVLEDNCEAMGARYLGKVAGSFGEMAAHSTFFSHHICTMEGGMVTTDDRYYYEMLLALRSHGWTRHLPQDNVFGAKVEKFHFIYPGYNVRPTEMQAAIGLEQLKKLDGFVAQRRENASRFPWRTQKEIGESSWFGFAVFDEDRAKVIGKYETRPVVTGNFMRQPVIRYYEHSAPGKCPNADYVHDYALMIGNSHERIEWDAQ